jgi:HEPN domain-containing protein
MHDVEKVHRVVREWVHKAENDLQAAIRLLRSGEGFPADAVCFHAEQWVEKYLKAYLTWAAIDFPKTHDIRLLLSLLPEDTRPELTAEEQRKLTAYATGARYPGWEDIPPSEAEYAVKLARRVRSRLRKILRRKTLVRRKT